MYEQRLWDLVWIIETIRIGMLRKYGIYSLIPRPLKKPFDLIALSVEKIEEQTKDIYSG